MGFVDSFGCRSCSVGSIGVGRCIHSVACTSAFSLIVPLLVFVIGLVRIVTVRIRAWFGLACVSL